MKKIKSEFRPSPALNTSALPDIVFMLLFFFMVVTVFRDSRLLLKIKLPGITQVKKLHHPSLVHHIYIGPPVDELKGKVALVQINDAVVGAGEIGKAVKVLVSQLPEPQRPSAMTSLRVDQSVEMGIVSEVKIALRKAGQYKLNYAAREKPR